MAYDPDEDRIELTVCGDDLLLGTQVLIAGLGLVVSDRVRDQLKDWLEETNSFIAVDMKEATEAANKAEDKLEKLLAAIDALHDSAGWLDDAPELTSLINNFKVEVEGIADA